MKTTQADYETLASFRYALRQFLHFSEQAAQEAGLSPQQHQALLAIKGFPGGGTLTIGDLAERLQVAHHSVVGLVNRMAADGLVLRQSDAGDRRVVRVSLTAKGLKILEKLTAVHKEELSRIGPRLHQALLQVIHPAV